MTLISWVYQYALMGLCVIGLVESVYRLWVAVGDMRIIRQEGVNGPKRLSTMGRVEQAAVLLAVFGVMAAVAAVHVFTPMRPLETYSDSMIATRTGLLIVAALLVLNQIMGRRNRVMLDAFYDATVGGYVHRRHDDPNGCAGHPVEP